MKTTLFIACVLFASLVACTWAKPQGGSSRDYDRALNRAWIRPQLERADQVLRDAARLGRAEQKIGASFLNICKSDDYKCARDTAANFIPIFAVGLPEYGVEPLDPLVFETIHASMSNMKFLLKDATVTGLKDCEAQKIQRDVSKSKMFLKFLCTADLDGQYELSGQVLVLPVGGKGKIHATLNKALVNLDLDIEEKDGEEDGKKRWHIKSWSNSYELKDKSDVSFDNLFEGYDLLGGTARQLTANNSDDIINEIAPPVMNDVVGRIVNAMNNFFKAVPVNELSFE